MAVERVVREPEVREADPELDSFRNANRPEALQEIERIVALRAGTQGPQ
jgi:hypothetical protein